MKKKFYWHVAAGLTKMTDCDPGNKKNHCCKCTYIYVVVHLYLFFLTDSVNT